MSNTIKIKRSTTTAAPGALAEGELAYSENSNNLFIGTSGNNITVIGGQEGMEDAAASIITSASHSGLTASYDDAARTLSLDVNDPTITVNGDMTGSVTLTDLADGTLSLSANISPTVTLGGDLGGSATFTNLGNASLDATIATDAVQKAMVNTDVITGQDALAENPDGDNDMLLIYDASAMSYKKVAAKYVGSNQLNELDDVDTSTATAGNLLIAGGTAWDSVAVSGDISISKLGVTDISADVVAAAELGVTAGTATANKALVVDANKDINLGTGDITAAQITGSLQTAAQGNVTSLGTLTGLTVDGNSTVADGTNDFDVASHDGTNGLKLGGTLVTSSASDLNKLQGVTNGSAAAGKAVVVDANKDISFGAGSITATGFTGSIETASQNNITSVGILNGLAVAAGQTVSMCNNRITNVSNPSQAQDAATKSYVDAVKTGLDVKDSVRVASTAAATLTTSFANGESVDGVALATGDRVLVKDQVDGSENGIYTVNASGAPTRAVDFAEADGGAFTFIEEGAINSDSGWVMSNDGGVTVGTTSLAFVQFSGAGSITAGTGMTKTGNTLDVVAGTGITSNANSVQIDTTWAGQAAISTVGTVTSGTWQANTIGVGFGGTGIASYSAGDLTYASGATAISKLGAGTAGQFLMMNSSANAPEWTSSIDGGTF